MSQKEKESKKEGLSELPSPVDIEEDRLDLLLPEKHPLRYHLHELIEHLRRHRNLTITEEQRETIGRYMQDWTKEEIEGSPKYKLPTYVAARRFIEEHEAELARTRSEYEEKLKGTKDHDERLRILKEQDEKLRELDVDRHILTLFCLDRNDNLVVDCLVGVSPRERESHIPTAEEIYFIDPSRKKGVEIARYESPVKLAEENGLRIVELITDTAQGVTVGISTYGITKIRK